MGLTASQEEPATEVYSSSPKNAAPRLSSSPTASSVASSSGRQSLRISQGIVPPNDEQKFELLLSDTECTGESRNEAQNSPPPLTLPPVSMRQIQQIMKDFGSENYKNNLDKTKFGEVMDKLGLLEKAQQSGFERAHLIDVFFDMFDEDKDSEVSFFEFVHGVSVLLKGTLEEKAKMFFRMYDHNHDGIITRREMAEIVTKFLQSTINFKKAQYRNMQSFIGAQAVVDTYEELGVDKVDDAHVNKIVDSAFEHADKDGDNHITLDEFVDWVKHSKALKTQMVKLGFRFPQNSPKPARTE